MEFDVASHAHWFIKRLRAAAFAVLCLSALALTRLVSSTRMPHQQAVKYKGLAVVLSLMLMSMGPGTASSLFAGAPKACADPRTASEGIRIRRREQSDCVRQLDGPDDSFVRTGGKGEPVEYVRVASDLGDYRDVRLDSPLD
mmetsp:Transcript_5793/g.22619  ORF Transcript_5793/g.22619 Transcript_5793/m.22619 type:complete len:142 (-) Transcript_5793:1129-1554(-)